MNKTEVPVSDNDMSLKEVFLRVKEYIVYLLRRWHLILLFATLGGALGWFLYHDVPDNYEASLTFMLNEDEGSSSSGGVGLILGQFGFSGGSGSGYNLEKVLALSKSNRIIDAVLLDPIHQEEDSFLLANELIKLYNLHEDWNATELEAFRFNAGSSMSLNIQGNSVLGQVRDLMFGRRQGVENLMAGQFSEDTGIVELKATTRSESASVELVSKQYEQLSTYYINKTTERQRLTFKLLTKKVDSIRLELTRVEYTLAELKDQSTGVFNRIFSVRMTRLQREAAGLSILYMEALKNREVTEFTLRNSTPFFQLIDAPSRPLNIVRISTFRKAIIGTFLGGFLITTLLATIKFMKDLF
jgi:hypothetical protein